MNLPVLGLRPRISRKVPTAYIREPHCTICRIWLVLLVLASRCGGHWAGVQPTAPAGRGQELAVLAVLVADVAATAPVAAWAAAAPTPRTASGAVVPSRVVPSSVAAVTGTRTSLRKSGT